MNLTMPNRQRQSAPHHYLCRNHGVKLSAYPMLLSVLFSSCKHAGSGYYTLLTFPKNGLLSFRITEHLSILTAYQ